MKLLVTDLDGTLLNGGDQISSCDREALWRARSAGITVAVATGRPLKEARWCIDEVNAYPYFVGMNGCQTVNLTTGQIYHQDQIPHPAATAVIEAVSRLPVFFEVYTESGIEALIEKRDWIYVSGLHEHYIKNAINDITFTDHIAERNETVFKFFIPTNSVKTARMLQAALKDITGIQIISSLGNFVEVIPTGCNKAVGLAALCAAEGISAEDIMAVGDSQNDIEMLNFCGIGAAVGNAKDEVKAVADIILPDHNHGGISAAVEYILKTI